MSTQTIMFENSTRTYSQELEDLLTTQRDARTKDWFLAESMRPLLTILGVYLFFCIYAGPRIMRNRKPFELKNTLIVYNALQVVFSVVLVYEFYVSGWGHYNYKCEAVSYGTDPKSMRMARAVYLYYIAKLTELLDTVFFVLRKKERQISFLHLYHHASMPLATLIGVQYFAGGQGTIVCLVNSFIHIIMYAYYMLAAMGPQVQKYLWWKRYITILQIVQFVIVFILTIQIQFQPNCGYNKIVGIGLTLNATLFIYLFSAFYVESYKKENKKKIANGDAVQKAAALKQD
ncbi:elongation of very long chain fatty acids protein AAEL008004-like [Musca vetustissima]|uniref:elongation of very long chain fatty acids protein AAEL008004-like n=1 Tax=Musca vetustissima TaxID=27455 RepID=UPI002AB69845|nr:elongation of very long chain fatty acids protein AAEL008004-like [Musca vetustissima]